MNGNSLTEAMKSDVRSAVIESCGSAAIPAISEIFEDAAYHGQNYTCRLVDEYDHMIVVLECDCSGHAEGQASGSGKASTMSELFKQGVILYYYHSIVENRHHICLALRKIGSAAHFNSSERVHQNH